MSTLSLQNETQIMKSSADKPAPTPARACSNGQRRLYILFSNCYVQRKTCSAMWMHISYPLPQEIAQKPYPEQRRCLCPKAELSLKRSIKYERSDDQPMNAFAQKSRRCHTYATVRGNPNARGAIHTKYLCFVTQYDKTTN